MGVQLPLLNNYIPVDNNIQPWVRPADWPTITDADDTIQFLYSDIVSNVVSIRYFLSGGYSGTPFRVDWGDGNIEDFPCSGYSTVSHTYNSRTGTACSRGYNTWVITITVTQASAYLYDVKLISNQDGNVNNLSKSRPVGLLEAYYGNNTQTYGPNQLFTGGNSPFGIGSYIYLEYVKLPTTISSALSANWTNWSYTFAYCESLAKVDLPQTYGNPSVSLNFSNTFNNCGKLIEITFPSAYNISNLSSTFYYCSSLTSVTLPSQLDSCTDMSSAFSYCQSLTSIEIPSINNCTNFNSMFNACLGLASVKFNSLPTITNSSLSMQSMFNGCYKLVNVIFPETCSSNPIYYVRNTFTSCRSLVSVEFPAGMQVNSLISACSQCFNLKKFKLTGSQPRLTDISYLFQSCYNLKEVTLPDTAGASISLYATFQSCNTLSEITIPSAWNVSSLYNTFNACTSLQTVNWSPGAQDSLTTMYNAFGNCYNLRSVGLPTSLNSCDNLSNTFSYCYYLESVELPSTMDSLTTLAATFYNCWNLKRVVLPTSAAVLNNISQTFYYNYALETITLPEVVSTNVNFNYMCWLCLSLTEVNLPTTQTSATTNIQQIFGYSGNNNTVIRNAEYLGSNRNTPLAYATNYAYGANIPVIELYCPLYQFGAQGQSSGQRSDVTSVRLYNTSAGQWTGGSPQVNVSYSSLSTDALIQLFYDLANQGSVSGKTINITGALGASGLSTEDRAIITNRGWTITG